MRLAPNCPSICVRILCDEAAQLNYQALTLGLVRRRCIIVFARFAFSVIRCWRESLRTGNSLRSLAYVPSHPQYADFFAGATAQDGES